MADITLITGGVRCGKSLYAEKLAQEAGDRVCYLATAEAKDAEMRERIKRHRGRRPAAWDTIEEPLQLAARIKGLQTYDAVILDCLTLWINNLLGIDYDDAAILAAAEEAIAAIAANAAPFMVVTNEVGWGIVPDNEQARRFRDVAGLVNSRFAAAAAGVFLSVAGIAVRIK